MSFWAEVAVLFMLYYVHNVAFYVLFVFWFAGKLLASHEEVSVEKLNSILNGMDERIRRIERILRESF